MGTALCICALSMLVGGFTTAFLVLICARFALGMGEGLHWPMQSTFCRNWFPTKEQGRANSTWIVGAKIGPVAAVPLFSFIVGHYGWRMTFIFLAVCSVFALFLVLVFTRDYPEQSRWVNKAEVDFIREGRAAKEQTREEKREAFRAGFKQLVANKDFWVLTVGYTCDCSIFWGMATWLPSYLKVARHFSWAVMGGYTALSWLLAAALIATSGVLSDKWGRGAFLLIIGFAGAATGIFLSAQTPNNLLAAWAITFGVALTGFCMGGHWALLPRIVSKDAMSSGSGIMNGVATVIAAFIPTIVGFFIRFTGSFNGGLMTLVGTALLGLVCGVILMVRKF